MALDPLLLEVLACPEDKGPLLYFEDEDRLYNPRLRRSYEVRDGIPVMLVDEATTVDLIARHGLRFPVGHSADAAAAARATGAFVNPDPPYLQSTGFVLDPGGRVIVSVYSSGAIGRLVPQDVIGLVGYLREHAQAS